jgi:hypothetical protein
MTRGDRPGFQPRHSQNARENPLAGLRKMPDLALRPRIKSEKTACVGVVPSLRFYNIEC